MAISTYLANKLLDHQVGKAAYTMPTTYVALSTTAPTAAGTNVTEPTTGGYARVATTAADWNSAAAGATSNAEQLSFPQATGDWSAGANLTYGVVYDAATAGNVLMFAPLTVPKSILSGDTAIVAPGDLDITLS